MPLKPQVEYAIEQIKAYFPEASVTTKDDGQGGAHVLVDPVDLGEQYTPETRVTWIGFHVSFQYPIADVYPHHVRPDLKRQDGGALGEGMSVSRFKGFDRESVQLSRRTKEIDWRRHTALLKLQKVIEWARSRP